MRFEKHNKINEVSMAIIIKGLDDGLTKKEVNALFDLLSGTEAIPIEIQGESCTAMGFINLYDAELVNYEYTEKSDLYQCIKEFLDDGTNCPYVGFYTLYTDSVDLEICIM